MTLNDLKIKIAKMQFYVYQLKACNPCNLKIYMEHIFVLLVTSNDP